MGSFTQTFENIAPCMLARDYKDPPALVFDNLTGGDNMNTPTYALDRAAYNQGRNAQFDIGISDEDRAQTLVAKGPGAVAVPSQHRYTIRRLTPTECARLQGFPDWWAGIPTITDMDDATLAFWQEVRETYAAINGKAYKPVAKKQMINWYNRLRTDSAEYKMWGNGVALPVVRIPLHGMAALGAKTMGSLFDGSGGFPLAGLLDGITTLWASERVEFQRPCPAAFRRQHR